MRILLVEDDELVAEVLQTVLTEADYAVDVACDEQTSWQLLSAADYDLILLDVVLLDVVLLDVVLPNLDGLVFSRRLSGRAHNVPVLLVTSLGSSQEKIAGLSAGADDYITKPFEVEDLLAHVRVLLRSVQDSAVSVLERGNLRLQPNCREVSYGLNVLYLTPKEYVLLELFLRNSAQVFSRSAILDSLWSYSDAPSEETVTAYIKSLRKKLADAGAPNDLIETVDSAGCRLKPLTGEGAEAACQSSAEQAPEELFTKLRKKLLEKSPERSPEKLPERSLEELPGGSPKRSPKRSLEKLPDDCSHNIKKAIATLWQTAKHQQLDRLNRLVQLEEIGRSRQLSNEEKQRVYQTAHSLSGTLGIFGLLEGSQIASEIETLVTGDGPLSAAEKSRFKALIDLLENILKTASEDALEDSMEPSAQPSIQSSEKAQPAVNKPLDLPLLLLVDTKLKIVSELVTALEADGFTIKAASEASRVRELFVALEQGAENLPPGFAEDEAAPDVILLKFAIADMDSELFDRLIGTTRPTARLNAIVCSASSQLSDRVKVVRLGNYPFLENPSIAAVMQGVREMRSPAQISALRVLAVDDDSQVLKLLSARLSRQGLHVDTLEQPLDFWQKLQSFAPDLLLLDIEMPRFNGLELCQAIRQAPEWSHLPVVFLTAHTDPQTIQAAIEAGANDLIEKTLSDSALFDRLMGHLKRSSLQRVTSAIATVHSPS